MLYGGVRAGDGIKIGIGGVKKTDTYTPTQAPMSQKTPTI